MVSIRLLALSVCLVCVVCLFENSAARPAEESPAVLGGKHKKSGGTHVHKTGGKGTDGDGGAGNPHVHRTKGTTHVHKTKGTPHVHKTKGTPHTHHYRTGGSGSPKDSDAPAPHKGSGKPSKGLPDLPLGGLPKGGLPDLSLGGLPKGGLPDLSLGGLPTGGLPDLPLPGLSGPAEPGVVATSVATEANNVRIPELFKNLDPVLLEKLKTVAYGHFGLDSTRPKECLDRVGFEDGVWKHFWRGTRDVGAAFLSGVDDILGGILSGLDLDGPLDGILGGLKTSLIDLLCGAEDALSDFADDFDSATHYAKHGLIDTFKLQGDGLLGIPVGIVGVAKEAVDAAGSAVEDVVGAVGRGLEDLLGGL